MGDNALRGDNRTDPIAGAVATDPQISSLLDERREAAMKRAIDEAIRQSGDRKLAGWVTVATWEDEDGSISHTVIGDGHSSALELKGFLHDGIWIAAHAE